MKKLILLVFLFTTLLVVSCSKDDIYGSGNIITEERNHRNFDGVEVQGSLEVHLVQSNQYRVRIESYENLMPFVETFVSNNVLNIQMSNGYGGGVRETVVWVYAPDVYEIKLSGSGLIVTDNRHNFGDYLEVGLTGSGDIDIRGTARTADIVLNGSGIIQLEGSGNNLSLYSSGSGDIRAFDYAVDEADVKLYGSGDALIDVWRFIDAEINGSGDIVYEGNPRIQALRTGSGVIRRR